MKRARFTEEQIIGILREQEAGAYAAYFTATCDRLRNPKQLRRSHIAPPAPRGVTSLGL
jgi:hypothetical protein